MRHRKLRLNLLGTPTLTYEGVDLRVSPPTAFELLALILLAGDEGISRKEAATRLWSHLDPKNASTQVRYNLMKLREHLQLVDASEIVNLDGQTLRANTEVWIDIREAKTEKPSKSRIKTLIEPVAQGWNPEHWLKEADDHAETLYEWFQALGDEADFKFLERALELYPTSFNLANLFVNRLKAKGMVTQANEVIIRFEDAWVDRFGTAEIPKIEAETTDHPSSKRGTRDGRPVALLVAILGVGTLLSTTFLKSGGDNRSNYPPIRVIAYGNQVWLGKSLKYTKIDSGVTTLFNMSALSDGSIAFMQRDQFQAATNTGKSWIISNGQPRPLKIGEEEFLVDTENGYVVTNKQEGKFARAIVKVNGIESVIKPIKDYPHSAAVMLLKDGKVLVQRMCDHPDRDHIQLIEYKDGIENIITTKRGLAQITTVTGLGAHGVLCKYSFGKSESWRYRFGYLPFVNGTVTSTEIIDLGAEATAIAEFESGSLAVRPEQTIKNSNDFNTSPTGEVRFVTRDLKSNELDIGGTTKFIAAHKFGNGIVVQVTPGDAKIQLRFTDSLGNEINPPKGVFNTARGILTCANFRGLMFEGVESTPEHHIYHAYTWAN